MKKMFLVVLFLSFAGITVQGSNYNNSSMNDLRRSCVGEGQSLGSLTPGNTKKCCTGLVNKTPKGLYGTRGTCEKSGRIYR